MTIGYSPGNIKDNYRVHATSPSRRRGRSTARESSTCSDL